MADAPKINQLDPFGDEGEFAAQKIRHSRSRESRKLKKNIVNPEEEKDKKRLRLAIIILAVITAVSVAAILLIPRLTQEEEAIEDDPVVNPTGREITSEYVDTAADDPELRTGEEEKLGTVLSLIKNQDWEFANALFETIYPRYLDNCGKYEYYRAALTLSTNFENFSIDADVAGERMEALSKKCNSIDE